MAKFEMLLSADMMVPDPDGMAALLVSKLGVHSHPRWRQAFDKHPYIAHFLRVQKSLAIAPTRIEPQVHLDKPNPGDPFFHDHLEGLEQFQGHHLLFLHFNYQVCQLMNLLFLGLYVFWHIK